MKNLTVAIASLLLIVLTSSFVDAIPNPASTYCKERGNKLEIRTNATTGGQYGICVSPNGKECEEWNFYCKCEPKGVGCWLGNFSCDFPCEELPCKKAGESVLVSECCEGLKEIPPIRIYDDECNETGMTGWTYICSDCGNNICESWENKCNCPEDCKESETLEKCDGCLYDSRCLDYGHRIKVQDIPLYCSIEGTFEVQKEREEECQNDYECLSNECSEGKCISTYSLLEKIFDLIKKLFGKFFGIGLEAVCGNGVIEKGETSKNCCIDVGCPEGQNCENNICKLTEETKKGCEKDSDCVWAFRPNSCCDCPQIYNKKIVDADNELVMYEKGKDYSSLRTIDCTGIQCSPCAPLTEVECVNNQCQKCVGEGGSINTMPGPSGEIIIGPRCCGGLTQITMWILESPGGYILQTDGAFCTKCGDGICKEPENSKNCPDDCVSYILHEWGVLLDGSVRTTPLEELIAYVAKPIIYLYSNNNFNLSLSVDFENGEAMEVWPYISTGKKISWNDFEISSDCETTPFPEQKWDMKEIYELGKYVVDTANCVTYQNVTSKILFYNGKIDFDNIITGYYADLGDKKEITLTNNLKQDVYDIYINYKKLPSYSYIGGLPVSQGANITLGVLKIDKLKAGETKDFEMTVNDYSSDIPIFWENQKKKFKQQLINKGLYADEANKFMIAWEDTFFGFQYGHGSNIDYRDGMSIIFILPEEKYNELFNLETSIKPQEIKRVGAVYSPIEELVPVTAASATIALSESGENCKNYYNQIKLYCSPFSFTYSKELCSKAEENYEDNDCCQSAT